MTERFTFPEHDAAQFRRDCDDLQELILEHPGVHAAWLRTTGSGEASDRSAELVSWEKEHLEAALEYGLNGAFSEGLVSSSQLRSLAFDATTFEMLADRVYAEGNSNAWQVMDPKCQIADVSRIAEQLLTELAASASRSGTAHAQPILENADLHTKSAGRLISGPTGLVYRFEAIIAENATLTLRWRERSWGKLHVQRRSSAQFAISSRTGVFLAYSLPTVLDVRLAASTELTRPVRHGTIQVAAVQDGVVVDIVLPSQKTSNDG